MEEKNNDQFQLTWLPKKTFEVLVSIPWEEIKKAREKAVEKASAEMEIKGFRKGKAPESLVVQTLGQERLLEMTLQEILPGYFQKAVSQLGLRPLVTPKIQIVSAKENELWQVKFTSCEEPEVDLDHYQEEIRKIKAVEKIWVPGKEGEKEGKKEKEDRQEKLNKIIDWLLKNIKVEICDLLLEEEVTRKLSDLLEQIQKLGITVDQYLASSGKTVEQIREEYRRSSQESLSLEFILGKIADSEKIEVSPAEIEKMIASGQSEEEKKALESQKYLLATLIRRQKTLDFLASL